jgi:hypothetical protein
MTTPAANAGSLNRTTRMSAIDIDLRARKKPNRAQTFENWKSIPLCSTPHRDIA